MTRRMRRRATKRGSIWYSKLKNQRWERKVYRSTYHLKPQMHVGTYGTYRVLGGKGEGVVGK